jgi:hypothetical protein
MRDYKDVPKKKTKQDWFLWIATGIALFFVVNALVAVMDSW